MKRCLIFLMIAVCFTFSAGELRAGENTTEQEIRQVICQIANGNYQRAQAELEKILQKDPQNVYALRLLPGVLTRQIKKGDQSPENIAGIRKAIGAYEQAVQRLQSSAEEKGFINSFITSLYRKISEKEEAAYLTRRSEDTSIPADERAKAYTSLAVKFYSCANKITEVPSVKKTVLSKGGREVYVFTKPKKPEDFDRLKDCTAKGMEAIDKAIELEKQSGKDTDSVWLYKASLLAQSARIAEMEGNTGEKERLNGEQEKARNRFREIADKNRDNYRDPVDSPSYAAPPEEIFTDLITFKAETDLKRLIPTIDIPSDYIELVAPVPVGPVRAPRTKKNEQAKRLWKPFAVDGDLVAVIPDNVKTNSYDTARISEADSEGLDFFIQSQPRPAQQTTEIDDKVLNVLAWTMARAISGFSMKDEWGNTFEINFVRNEKISGQPAKIYAYSLSSCKSKTDGVLIMLAGKKNNYAISIKGANEQDARTQRFLKSLKIKG